MLENVCIESSTDYKSFKTLIGNRPVNSTNVRKLVASMSTSQLASIGVVNKNKEVIDGRHRLEACKELKLPFYYITMPDYGIEEVHVLNTNMKNWTNEDFVRQFADRFMHGEHIFKDYKVLVDFMDDEKLKMGNALALLENGRKSGTEQLREGTFKVLSVMEVAYKNLEELKDLESELGTKMTTTVFWQCYVLSKQVKGFSGAIFLRKSKMGKAEIESTKNSIEHMLSTFEDVYNHKNRNPIALAFDATRIYRESRHDGK